MIHATLVQVVRLDTREGMRTLRPPNTTGHDPGGRLVLSLKSTHIHQAQPYPWLVLVWVLATPADEDAGDLAVRLWEQRRLDEREESARKFPDNVRGR